MDKRVDKSFDESKMGNMEEKKNLKKVNLEEKIYRRLLRREQQLFEARKMVIMLYNKFKSIKPIRREEEEQALESL